MPYYSPLEALLQRLSQQAGPRGYTFAGRAMQPGESLMSALTRFPQGEAEYGGIAMQAPDLLRTLLIASIAKLPKLPKAAFTPLEPPRRLRPRLARPEDKPTTEPFNMFPALFSEKSGEIVYAKAPSWSHGQLLHDFKKPTGGLDYIQRGFVDPTTGLFYQDTIIEAMYRRLYLEDPIAKLLRPKE